MSSFNFFLYNVYHNVGTHYGTHPWHWFITQGYPTLLFSHILLIPFGIQFKTKKPLPIIAILFNIFVYRYKIGEFKLT